MATTDIAFVISGDLHRNIRALKQIRSLSEGGYSVKVFHLGGNAVKTGLPDSVSEEIVSVSPGQGPRFFHRLHRSFLHALSGQSFRLFHASDLYVLSACASAAARFETLYSFDSRELYAHVVSTVRRPWVRWYWSRLEHSLLKDSACIFTVSDSIADHLSHRYHINRPIVVHNVPETGVHAHIDEQNGSAEFGDEHKLLDEHNRRQTLSVLLENRGIPTGLPTLVHLGQMKPDRGCERLIEAMTLVHDAQLIFLGYGPLQQHLEQMTALKNVQNRVHFVPPVGPREVNIALEGATIGVTMLEDTCLNHRYALPNKLFDYINAGLPILSSNLQEVSRVVNVHHLGKTADPSDFRTIASAINEMICSADLPTWSKNASIASETFSWENASQRFMLEINRVLSQSLSS